VLVCRGEVLIQVIGSFNFVFDLQH